MHTSSSPGFDWSGERPYLGLVAVGQAQVGKAPGLFGPVAHRGRKLREFGGLVLVRRQ
jgi:hypothetical protein